MSATINTGTEKQITVPVAEFLAFAGIPDPEKWHCRNGSVNVCITVYKYEDA